MIFQSIDYLIFFICTFALYWQLPRRGQHALLLAAGYIFYGYVHPWYCILLGATTLVDFTFTRLMEDKPDKKRVWLMCILVSNFSILAVFKYFGFFTENLIALLQVLGWDVPVPVVQMLLPAGVSFYTFQSCSYASDVYRGQTWARRSLLDYAVYVAFFPQLVAGPIERAGHLLVQFENPRRFHFGVARDALFLILWGLVKKRVIADTAAVYCNKAFSLSRTAPSPLFGQGHFASASRFMRTSQPTRISHEVPRGCSALSFVRTSTIPGWPNLQRIFGGAGTCHFRLGFVIMFSSHSADREAVSCASHGI